MASLILSPQNGGTLADFASLKCTSAEAFTSAVAFAAAATETVTTETLQWLNLLRYWRQWLLGRLGWQKCKFGWELIQPCVL